MLAINFRLSLLSIVLCYSIPTPFPHARLKKYIDLPPHPSLFTPNLFCSPSSLHFCTDFSLLPTFSRRFLPPPYIFAPISPSSLHFCTDFSLLPTFSHRFLPPPYIFAPISPSSLHFCTDFSLLPTFSRRFLPLPYFFGPFLPPPPFRFFPLRKGHIYINSARVKGTASDWRFIDSANFWLTNEELFLFFRLLTDGAQDHDSLPSCTYSNSLRWFYSGYVNRNSR